jgi:4-hydroxybenzoate polyprenyltransferase
MRQDTLAIVGVLLMLILAATLGPDEAVSSVIALGIVLVYGAVLALARRRRTHPRSILGATIAALAAPLLAALVALWSHAVGQPFVLCALVWMGIIAAGAACAWVARRHEAYAGGRRAPHLA